jgi:hypothetical protein
VDPFTAKYIAQLKMPDPIKTQARCPTSIPVNEHIKGWKKTKESPSASGPSHFGMYIAGSNDPLIAKLDSTMREIPYSTGFSYKRWYRCLDVQILKKLGVWNIEKLRTILLLEANFNMNNKKLGRDAMQFAERCNALAKEQYGGRKNHRAAEVALNAKLVNDIFRQTKRAGVICSNDAQSCFDRIVHSVCSLSLQRLGMPLAPIISMLTTLQNLTHYVRTAFGDSDAGYGGPNQPIPMQGLGQGNGAGPAGWIAVSTPLIEMMRAEGFGFSDWMAISKRVVEFVCYSFIDDTDLVHTSPNPDARGRDVLLEMQNVLDHWEGGIRATGGALVPEKSYYYVIDSVWEKEAWRYATIEECPGELSIRDVDGDNRVTIARLDIHESREALGVWNSPDGKNTTEFLKLKQKSKQWAENIRIGHLRRDDAWEAMNTTILRSLDYPLMATTLSEEECRKIISPVLLVALPRSKVQRRMPRQLVHGPLSRQGLAVSSLFTNQLIQHLQACLRHGGRNTITGQLLQSSGENLIL